MVQHKILMVQTVIALDDSGNIYVADTGNHRIRKITPSGVVTTIAGDGTAGFADANGTSAKFNNPAGVTVDSDSNIYVTDEGNNRIRKITPSGVVTTIAGDGTAGFADANGTSAKFNSPHGIAVDSSKNLYVTDRGNHSVRKISTDSQVTTIAGDGTAGFFRCKWYIC